MRRTVAADVWVAKHELDLPLCLAASTARRHAEEADLSLRGPQPTAALRAEDDDLGGANPSTRLCCQEREADSEVERRGENAREEGEHGTSFARTLAGGFCDQPPESTLQSTSCML